MPQMIVELVGDIVAEAGCTKGQTLFDHDSPTEEEVSDLRDWLHDAGYQVRVRTSVREFADRPPNAGEALVFPLWRGGASRNRTAIVPAICEARGLPYVGGDAFVQTVCQNKSLSKLWARAAGFDVPAEILYCSPRDLEGSRPVSHLNSPCVVKPLASACSIGITADSLCMNDFEAAMRAKELFAAGLGPVMCEAFVAGEEVSLCIIEESGVITSKCMVGYRDHRGECPFRHRLFTFEDKINRSPNWRLEVLTPSADDRMWLSVEALLRWLGRIDYFRFDGRLTDGGFVLGELTPDIHMALSSSFLGGFFRQGVEPSALLDKLIRTSLRNHGHALPESLESTE